MSAVLVTQSEATSHQIQAMQIPQSSNSNVACCIRPFPSSHAVDAIHLVLQEIGLGDSETTLYHNLILWCPCWNVGGSEVMLKFHPSTSGAIANSPHSHP